MNRRRFNIPHFDDIPFTAILDSALDGAFRTIRIKYHAMDIPSFFSSINNSFIRVIEHLLSDHHNIKLHFSLCVSMFKVMDDDRDHDNVDHIYLSLKTMKLIDVNINNVAAHLDIQ